EASGADPDPEIADPEGEELVSLPEREPLEGRGHRAAEPQRVERELCRHRPRREPQGGAEPLRPEQRDGGERGDEEEEGEGAPAADKPAGEAVTVDVAGQPEPEHAVDRGPDRPGEEG